MNVLVWCSEFAGEASSKSCGLNAVDKLHSIHIFWLASCARQYEDSLVSLYFLDTECRNFLEVAVEIIAKNITQSTGKNKNVKFLFDHVVLMLEAFCGVLKQTGCGVKRARASVVLFSLPPDTALYACVERAR